MIPKSEAIAALREVQDFAQKAVVAFEDLKTRCAILEATIRHSDSDSGLDENQIKQFNSLSKDWEEVAKTL